MPARPGLRLGLPQRQPRRLRLVSTTASYLPLGADRTPEYYFPRYFAVPADQMFLPTYYNPYVTRGQRLHPVRRLRRRPPGGRARRSASAMTPVHPYNDTLGSGPRVARPDLHRPRRGPAGQPRAAPGSDP